MPLGKKEGYDLMVGGDRYNRSILLDKGETYELIVPLEFWFCRNVGLALPLIALQYHEVKINIEYGSVSELCDFGANYCNKAYEIVVADHGETITGPVLNSALIGSTSSVLLENVTMWVDYVFLDTDERRRFAQLSHEYLIEQLQFTGSDTVTASGIDSMKSIRLNFNHPVKELIWTIRGGGTGQYWNNYSDNIIANATTNEYALASNPVLKAKLQLNGNDRMAEREGSYFSIVQPYQHHENTPDKFHPGINVYSFAIKPEEHQPSGTLNMSRIDTAILSVSSAIAGSIYVYAVNYNVLRILSGMGGLAYSN